MMCPSNHKKALKRKGNLLVSWRAACTNQQISVQCHNDLSEMFEPAGISEQTKRQLLTTLSHKKTLQKPRNYTDHFGTSNSAELEWILVNAISLPSKKATDNGLQNHGLVVWHIHDGYVEFLGRRQWSRPPIPSKRPGVAGHAFWCQMFCK